MHMMMAYKLLAAMAALAAMLLAVGCDDDSPRPTIPFEPGQVWTYRTRPGEEGSRVIVCRVENDADLGQIVHVYVNGLRMRNKNAPHGTVDHVPHMAYSARAMRRSVVKLEATGTSLPQFEERYHEWRTKFMQSRAGVWTAPLADSIAGMESVMSQ
jgi:hypothetical protein